MSEEVRAENCSDFSHVVQSCGRIVHEFYGTIYANKENGKLESNKRMWLYEKIHMDDFLPAEAAEMKPTIQRIRRPK